VSKYAFTRSRRLLNSSDFQPVFDSAPFRASHKYFLILARPSNTDTSRLGLVIAKKNIKLAVDRNRIKRLVRECFRQLTADDVAVDAVFLTRRGLGEMDNAEFTKQLQQQWQRVFKKARKAQITPES
jgi:ribonuclease P protein component|tara:strand:+ start:542 stop:922 length:381 start_codon:yes stop_codon:yes gene_type:complete